MGSIPTTVVSAPVGRCTVSPAGTTAPSCIGRCAVAPGTAGSARRVGGCTVTTGRTTSSRTGVGIFRPLRLSSATSIGFTPASIRFSSPIASILAHHHASGAGDAAGTAVAHLVNPGIKTTLTTGIASTLLVGSTWLRQSEPIILVSTITTRLTGLPLFATTIIQSSPQAVVSTGCGTVSTQSRKKFRCAIVNEEATTQLILFQTCQALHAQYFIPDGTMRADHFHLDAIGFWIQF